MTIPMCLRAIAFLVAVFSLGCSSAINSATATANATAAFMTTAHPALSAAQRAHGEAAIQLASDAKDAQVLVAKVNAIYDPVWDAYEVAQIAWVVAGATIETARLAEAAGADPDIASVTAAMAKLAVAIANFQKASAMIQKAVQ